MREFRRPDAYPILEVRRSCQENSCYKPHTHDSFSIGLIDSGSAQFAGSPSGAVELLPGDVVVIPTNQVHCCNPDDGLWQYQMVHIDHDWMAKMASNHGVPVILDAITVLRNEKLHRTVSEWIDLAAAGASPVSAEAGIVQLLQQLASCPPALRVSASLDADLLNRLRPVLKRLQHDESAPRLADLAALVDMTTFQLVRAMKRATGLPPLAWRHNVRILEARRMLREGRPIAETANVLGFADQSHFHRVFRSHVAASPGAYRSQ